MDSPSGAFAEPPPRTRAFRPVRVVVATVLGWNVLALVALYAWGVYTLTVTLAGVEFAGLGVLVIVGIMTVAMLASMVLGLTVALVRLRRPGRLPPAITREAVKAGSRAAAWGLVPIVVIPALVFYLSA